MIDCEKIEELQAEGLTERAIAARLGIAPSTVNKYKNRALIIEPSEAWGLGPAQLVKPASRKGEDETVVVGSDFHYTFHDVNMIASFLELIRVVSPHRVVLNGDMADFFQLSRFNKGLDRLDTLQDELDQTNDFRRQVRAAAPDAVIDETEGNHDSRLRTFVQLNARALTSLRSLKPAVLNAWDENEINPYGENGFRIRQHFLIKHGTMVRGEAGASAKAELLASGISGASGHTHRLAPYVKSGYVQREWWEGGCLCRLDPDYVPGGVPNWRNGCLVITFSGKTDNFVVEPVYRFDDKLSYGGWRF